MSRSTHPTVKFIVVYCQAIVRILLGITDKRNFLGINADIPTGSATLDIHIEVSGIIQSRSVSTIHVVVVRGMYTGKIIY